MAAEIEDFDENLEDILEVEIPENQEDREDDDEDIFGTDDRKR